MKRRDAPPVSGPRRGDSVDHLLGELQAAIMRHMWARPQATVRDLVDLLHAEERNPAYTTVMTVMGRLVTKGLLSRELRGKTHMYRAIGSEQDFLRAAAASRVQSLVQEFGDLAIAQFVAKVDDLSPERHRQLARLARGEPE